MIPSPSEASQPVEGLDDDVLDMYVEVYDNPDVAQARKMLKKAEADFEAEPCDDNEDTVFVKRGRLEKAIRKAHAAKNASVTPIRPGVATSGPSGFRQQHGGHMRIAERLVASKADELRYAHGLGWHLWDGSRWSEDLDGGAYRVLKEVVGDAYADLRDMSEDERKVHIQAIRAAEKYTGMEGTLRIAASMKPVGISYKDVDVQPHLFNLPSGTLDLTDVEIRPHDRTDNLTKMAAADPEYVEDGIWERFLSEALPDADVRNYLKRFVGYAMYGAVTEHKLPILTGTGRNGKGTFRDAVLHAFGDYAIEVDPALLMESKHERHGTFKMRLRGARLVFSSETEKGRRFAEATMKRLVGGDPIEANYMHRDPITFDPTHAMLMLTNHLPDVSGDDPAVWARLRVVPFDVVFPEEKQDKDLPQKLRDAAPQVIAWAIEGWREYQKIGLAEPEAVKARTKAYHDDSDSVGRFMEEMTKKVDTGGAPVAELFSTYTKWCKTEGVDPITMKDFSGSMQARGYEKKRTKRGYEYVGIFVYALDDEDDDDDESPRF